jgi:uncharacterized protein (DUF302 family)
MADVPYGIVKHVKLEFPQALELARAVLKDHGFGVVTELDVQQTMQEKLDKEYRPYVILGVCNPHFAHDVLEAEPDLGLMLPCNVAVYQEAPGEQIIEAVSPLAIVQVADNPEVAAVAAVVQTKLEAAMEEIEVKARAAGA